MKLILAIPGIALLAAAPAFAQNTGVSHPEQLDDAITSTSPAQQHYVKPSPDVPIQATTVPAMQTHEVATPDEIYHAYTGATTAALQPASSRPFDPDAAVVGDNAGNTVVAEDLNSGVVIDVPAGPNDLPPGTLLKAHLQTPLATNVTRSGSRFSATLSSDVLRNGKVFLPAGSLIHGRVSQVHGGHRIGGPAAIHLQAESIMLPDGTSYPLNADVIDLAHFRDAHVNSEGTIVGNGHGKATLTALGLTTGSAAAAGAMIGGGVGAVVGAGIGAGIGTIWWLKRDRQESLPIDTEIIFSLDTAMHFDRATR